MKIFRNIQLYFYCILISAGINAQEIEESAEVFLEDYTDEFQEKFFEALKQKGIENYDRAINLLLECKRIKENDVVVDYELAKAYFVSKEYVSGQEYAITAVNADPKNLWYLDILVKIISRQGRTIEEEALNIPFKNIQLKENLALIYFRSRNYKKATNILEGIKLTPFSEDLLQKMKNIQKAATKQKKHTPIETIEVKETSPLEKYKEKIEKLIQEENFSALDKVSMGAIESFPLQPYFYYANGLANNKNAKHKKAIKVLENALDYLLSEDGLGNKIYKELVIAYKALGNSSKTNKYLSKIK
ncbi:MAG: hypothetical protein V3U92_04450 [Cellulophaga sp.]